jgi:hypothetical protein
MHQRFVQLLVTVTASLSYGSLFAYADPTSAEPADRPVMRFAEPVDHEPAVSAWSLKFMHTLRRQRLEKLDLTKPDSRDMCCTFDVNPSGKITDLKVLSSSGIASYDEAWLTSIKNSVPLKTENLPHRVSFKLTVVQGNPSLERQNP